MVMVIGRHNGIIHYTVGQRKGLGLAMGHPVFVVAIRPETNEVVIGRIMMCSLKHYMQTILILCQ